MAGDRKRKGTQDEKEEEEKEEEKEEAGDGEGGEKRARLETPTKRPSNPKKSLLAVRLEQKEPEPPVTSSPPPHVPNESNVTDSTTISELQQQQISQASQRQEIYFCPIERRTFSIQINTRGLRSSSPLTF